MNDRALQMRLVRWAPPIVTLTVAVILGTLYGVQLVVLTLAAGALLLVIALLWNSVQALAGESELSFEEAFSMGARSAEEEQKRAVLRALKDLDYERSVGKISEEDYHEYSARYRAEAKRLIRDLDENLAEARKQVERELERRVARLEPSEDIGAEVAEPGGEEPLSPKAVAVVEATSSPEHARPIATKYAPKQLRVCTACQTRNELDARFCKSCGAGMAGPDERLCAACSARYPWSAHECPDCGSAHEGKP
jgi:ribosomal protein L40E